ncbi:hypothetical protein MPSEU_000983500 [Mayamaea pseudoterrestris]|nr:hypothetical protein MPSEU_000983500 [Mayamaea pseudoterrestris]
MQDNRKHTKGMAFISGRLLMQLLMLMISCFVISGFYIKPTFYKADRIGLKMNSQLIILHATLNPINGERDTQAAEDFTFDLADAADIDESEVMPTAPPVTYKKFITMQDKRVLVTIRYSGESGLRPYFLTVAKRLKQSHPDVIVERRILPPAAHVSSETSMEAEATFEVLVDGTMVVGRTRARRAKVARVDMSRSRSVYVSMQELDVAIARARRRRRPSTTVYGDAAAAQSGAMRKEMLRDKNGAEDGSSGKDDAFL